MHRIIINLNKIMLNNTKKYQIWDDESYENDNFAKAFPKYTTQEINHIE